MIKLRKHNSGFDYNRVGYCKDMSKILEVTDDKAELLKQHKLVWQNGELVENKNYEEQEKERLEQLHQKGIKKKIRVLNIQIRELKMRLADTDYRAIKYSEGLYTDEEYEPYRKQRQEWRDEINELESVVASYN